MAHRELFYLPWTDGVANAEPGFRLAKGLATRAGRPLTVVLPHKNHLREYLRREHVVTPRSGSTTPGSLVVAIHPDLRMMSRFFHADDDVPFMVVDYYRNHLEAWARVNGAVHLLERTAMTDERPEEVRRIHDEIEQDGYNGYTSPPGSYTIRAQLQKLDALGWLDARGRRYLVGRLLGHRSEYSLEQLEKLLAKWFGNVGD